MFKFLKLFWNLNLSKILKCLSFQKKPKLIWKIQKNFCECIQILKKFKFSKLLKNLNSVGNQKKIFLIYSSLNNKNTKTDWKKNFKNLNASTNVKCLNFLKRCVWKFKNFKFLKLLFWIIQKN